MLNAVEEHAVENSQYIVRAAHRFHLWNIYCFCFTNRPKSFWWRIHFRLPLMHSRNTTKRKKRFLGGNMVFIKGYVRLLLVFFYGNNIIISQCWLWLQQANGPQFEFTLNWLEWILYLIKHSTDFITLSPSFFFTDMIFISILQKKDKDVN